LRASEVTREVVSFPSNDVLNTHFTSVGPRGAATHQNETETLTVTVALGCICEKVRLCAERNVLARRLVDAGTALRQ
jgi:hypothetical protein